MKLGGLLWMDCCAHLVTLRQTGREYITLVKITPRLAVDAQNLICFICILVVY